MLMIIIQKEKIVKFLLHYGFEMISESAKTPFRERWNLGTAEREVWTERMSKYA